MIQEPVMQGEGSAVSRAGIRMGLAILAVSGLLMVAWIVFVIWLLGRLV
jgi:hypothetical protein